MACLVERAPCLPSRMWCISSRMNSPACVVAASPRRLSRRARLIVSISAMIGSRPFLPRDHSGSGHGTGDQPNAMRPHGPAATVSRPGRPSAATRCKRSAVPCNPVHPARLGVVRWGRSAGSCQERRRATVSQPGRERQSPRHFSMIRSFHLADLFTLANGGSGTTAIFFAMAYTREQATEQVYAAGALVVLALVFDVLDGRIARWRHRASLLGRELDSLADVVSFGVAPACLAFAVGMTGLLDQLILVYFVVCGISRLARYNVTVDAMSEKTGKVTYFEGTPIPTSVVLVLLVLVLAKLGRVGGSLPFG